MPKAVFDIPALPDPQTPNFDEYRPSAGVVLINGKGQIFAAERADIAGAWQMPQGGIDPGETPEEAGRRELFEETGIAHMRLLAHFPGWLTYDFPNGAKRTDGSWKGQAQHWMIFRFTGPESEINLEQNPQEFIRWRWMQPEEMLASVALFRKPIYEKVFEQFAPIFHLSKRPVSR